MGICLVVRPAKFKEMVSWRRNFLLSKEKNACNEISMNADLNKREHLRRIRSRRGIILAAASILVLAAVYGVHFYLTAHPTSAPTA